MPAKSKAQRILIAIALHHPDEVSEENKGVLDMSKSDMHDFAATKEKDLPEHVAKKKKKLKDLLGEK